MAERDPAFLYYDADVALDVAHMNRLERGCYLDLIQFYRKFRGYSMEQLRKILGNDMESCWNALELALEFDQVDSKYHIPWLRNSLNKREKGNAQQKDRIQKYWDEKKKDVRSGNTTDIPRNNQTYHLEEPKIDHGNTMDIPIVNEIVLSEIKMEIEKLVAENGKARVGSNKLADYFHSWLKKLGIPSQREYPLATDSDRDCRFDIMVFSVLREPKFIIEVKNYARRDGYTRPLKQIERYSRHNLPILFVPNCGSAFDCLMQALVYHSKNELGDRFISSDDQTNSFAFATELPAWTLEAAEMNQFTHTGSKNSQFVKDQWSIFVLERVNDPPKEKMLYSSLPDLTKYFTNWMRNKFPKNGTIFKGTGSSNGKSAGTIELIKQLGSDLTAGGATSLSS